MKQKLVLKTDGLLQAIERYIAKAESDLKEQLEAEGFVAAGVAVEHIGEIEDAVTDAVHDRVDGVLERLQAALGVSNFISDIWPEVSSEEELVEALRKIFEEQFDGLLHQFTKAWLIAENPDFPEVDDRITKPSVDFIQSWSSQLASLMHLTTNSQIEQILLQADEQKQTIEEVAKAIADSGIRECGYRARRVAVTEGLRVEGYAQQEAMVQNPLCYKKKWIHTGEAKVPRPNHQAIHGQEVFKRETFTLVGKDGKTYHPICPRDTSLPAAESIHCHCRMEAVSDKNAIGMNDEELLELRRKAMDEVDAEWDAVHASDTVDMIKSMKREDQLRYFGGKDGGKQRLARVESGVIATDKELDRLYKVDETGRRVRKSLQELTDDGIFTVSDKALKHAVEGDFTGLRNPKLPSGKKNGGNMRGGGHSQANIDLLKQKGIQFEADVLPNGVRIGGVENHHEAEKRLGNTGQAWFPEDWDETRILNAGTYTANKPALIQKMQDKNGTVVGFRKFQKYDDVVVGIIEDGQHSVGTVFPDIAQREIGD